MKRKQLVILLILIFVFAGLVGGYSIYSVYLEKKQANEQEEEGEQSISLHTADKDTINEIEYTYLDEKVSLIKEDSEWKEKNTGAPINEEDMDAMLNAVSEIVANKVIIDKTDSDILSQFGLDAPQVSYTVKTTDEATHSVIFGCSLVSDDAYYAIVDGEEKVYSVSQDYYLPFEKSLTEIIEIEDEICVEADKIKEMSITAAAGDLDFSAEYVGASGKNTYYTWKITKPYEGIMADTDSLQEILTTFSELEYKYCIGYGVGRSDEYGTGDEKTTIKMVYDSGSGKEEYILHVGKLIEFKEMQYYCVRPDHSDNVYLADVDAINKLTGFTAFSLADPCIYSVLVKDLKGFDIELDGKKYSVVRKEVKKTANDDSKSKDDTKNEYYVNGKKSDENELLTIYSLAYLLTYSGEADKKVLAGEDAGECVLKFTYHTNEGEDLNVSYLTYDGNNFYSVDKDGMNYFLTDKRGVDEIITAVREFAAANNL